MQQVQMENEEQYKNSQYELKQYTINVGAAFQQYFIDLVALAYISQLNLIVSIAQPHGMLANKLKQQSKFFINCNLMPGQYQNLPPLLNMQINLGINQADLNDLKVIKLSNKNKSNANTANNSQWIIVIQFLKKEKSKTQYKFYIMKNKPIAIQYMGQIQFGCQTLLFPTPQKAQINSFFSILQKKYNAIYKQFAFTQVGNFNQQAAFKNFKLQQTKRLKIFKNKNKCYELIQKNECILPMLVNEQINVKSKIHCHLTNKNIDQIAMVYGYQQMDLLHTFKIYENKVIELGHKKYSKVYSMSYAKLHMVCLITGSRMRLMQASVILVNTKTLCTLYCYSIQNRSIFDSLKYICPLVNSQLTLVLIGGLCAYILFPHRNKSIFQIFSGDTKAGKTKKQYHQISDNQIILVSMDWIHKLTLSRKIKQQEEEKNVRNYMVM